MRSIILLSPSGRFMKILLSGLAVVALLLFPARAQDVTHAVHGTVTKVDDASKTVVVKTKDGTEQTIHVGDRTTVRGADATAAGAKDTFHGVTEASEVVVHYTEKGTEKT